MKRYCILLLALLLGFACKKEVPLEGAKLSPTALNMIEGLDAQKVYLYLYPSYTTQTGVTWVSDNPDIASVDANGIVTPLTPGQTEVSVYSGDRKLASCSVTVKPFVPVADVSLDPTEVTIYVKGTVKRLTASVLPADASIPDLIWSSDDEGVVTVNQGALTAVAEGTATITVTTKDGGYWKTCDVTVLPPIPPKNLIVNGDFEDPGNTAEGDSPIGWTQVPAAWFTANYPDASAITNGTLGFKGTNGTFYSAGNGKEIGSFFTGNAAARFPMNNTNGIYQIVEVEAGADYTISLDLGLILWNATAMSLRGCTDMVNVLSEDGNTNYYPLPISIPPLDTWQMGTTHQIWTAHLTWTFHVPDDADYTKVRFQIDRRHFLSPDQALLMGFDEVVFEKE